MTTSSPARIAMWSGPRNISTAMMRSFEARGDTAVTDEPLYAHYLEQTGLAHPMAAEVRAHHDTDAARVVAWLTGPVPDGCAVWYQKHMAHHLLPGMDRGWLAAMEHAFLIREPAAMIASLANKLGPPRLDDTGLPQQVEIYRAMRSAGRTPPVVDSQDVLADPAGVLGLLCERLGIEFTDSMLRWEPGLRPTDGIWATHWYDAVAASTGFGPPPSESAEPVRLVPELEPVLDACRPLYEELAADRIRA